MSLRNLFLFVVIAALSVAVACSRTSNKAPSAPGDCGHRWPGDLHPADALRPPGHLRLDRRAARGGRARDSVMRQARFGTWLDAVQVG